MKERKKEADLPLWPIFVDCRKSSTVSGLLDWIEFFIFGLGAGISYAYVIKIICISYMSRDTCQS
jgi:hypothetical protein